MGKKSIAKLFFIFVVIFLIIYVLFLDSASLYKRFQIKRKLAKKEAEMEFFEKENERLAKENNDLETNTRSWESKARDLGMQKEAEEIYRFKQEKDDK